MTIQEILGKIQNERYGEIVRQSIIDGIQLCYDERAFGGYNPVEDLNDFLNGSALFDSSIANVPTQSSFIVMSAGTSTNCCQVAIEASDLDNSYLRTKQDSIWTSWMLIGTTKILSYWNYNGSELLNTESVGSGNDGIWDGAPDKDPTQQYEYTFLGWSTDKNATIADENATKNITADRDVYAAYRQSVRNYTVYFYNGLTLLGSIQVPYGSNASDATIERPSKESTAQYDYVFAGWSSRDGDTMAESGVLNNITVDKTVYAAFGAVTRSYNVYFYNGSTLLDTVSVLYGNNAAYTKATPTKVQTAQYRYDFVGWNSQDEQTSAESGVLNYITGEKTVYAAFNPVIRTYTVRFMNGTTVLQTVENVPYGSSASYTGSTPRHPTDPEEYTFAGFNPDGTNIQTNTDCQAIYILNPKELRYWNYDGSELLHTELIEVGGDGKWNGTSSKPSTTEHSYIFLGWNTSKNASVADTNATKNVTDDRDVYAAFEETVKSYSVRFFNGSTLLYTDHVQYGSTASYIGNTPTKSSTAQYNYSFVGWASSDGQSVAESGILTNITADKDVFAAFSSTLQQYTVTFMNGATTLGTVMVDYGTDATYSGNTPTKDQTPQYTYTFVGWNSQDEQSTAETGVLNNITANKTVYAAFSSTTREYTVSFMNGSTLITSVSVPYGGNTTYGGPTPTKASTQQYNYTFVGWNSQDEQSTAESDILNNITAEKTVYAAFSATLVTYNVYFYNGSELLYTDTVSYGGSAVYSGEAPTKASTEEYDYTFVGWNSQKNQTTAESGVLENVTANKTVYAAFSQVARLVVGNRTVGTSIWINEYPDYDSNGYGIGTPTPKEYIYLGKDGSTSTNCILLRRWLPNFTTKFDQKANSDLTTDYNTTVNGIKTADSSWLMVFDRKTQNSLVNSKIYYIASTGTSSSDLARKSIMAKCFSLGYYEYGFTRSDPSLTDGVSYLSALKKFYGNTDDDTARKAYVEGSSSASYVFTRSTSVITNVYIITPNGTSSDAGRGSNFYIRPAISVNPNTPVTISSGKTYLAPT